LRFQRQCTAASERIVKSGQLVTIEEFLGSRMGGVLGAGVAPALPDFVASLPQHLLVGGVLPLNEFFDDAEQPLPLLLLRLFSLKNVRMPRGVITPKRSAGRGFAVFWRFPSKTRADSFQE